MVFFHDNFRFVLSLVMHDSDHVLSNLDLAHVRAEVSFNGVVTANRMTVENFHATRRDCQSFGQDEVFSCG